ncbi:hypothetical protein ACFRIB_38210 [Streptomyces mirabilis]|uniref:hypothetical protein n=1 Tax=Streptomyces mirabilis TaxID=68239 RepID=UPI00368B5B3F
MATFAHITPERCAQFTRELTAAGLVWHDNGHQDDPKFLAFFVTDPHGRVWWVTPAASHQTSASCPEALWQAICEELVPGVATTPVMSARMLAAHMKDHPA